MHRGLVFFPVTPVTAEIHGACMDGNGAGLRLNGKKKWICVCVRACMHARERLEAMYVKIQSATRCVCVCL